MQKVHSVIWVWLINAGPGGELREYGSPKALLTELRHNRWLFIILGFHICRECRT